MLSGYLSSDEGRFVSKLPGSEVAFFLLLFANSASSILGKAVQTCMVFSFVVSAVGTSFAGFATPWTISRKGDQ
jgi:hypothetical protein